MKKTPLHAAHVALNARMVDFGGWHMPVQYAGLSQEHQAVRTKAGLFDVSHMGEVTVEGPDAEKFLNYLVTNNVSRLQNGQALYTVMCYENGGIVDDLLVYRRGENRYLLCINAGNIDKDWGWIEAMARKYPGATARHVSDQWGQIALQGPLSPKILARLTEHPLDSIRYYWFAEFPLLDAPCIVSRTGYTGEDGFEIYCPADATPRIWNALLEAGGGEGLVPCGLGARDTLRTEMKFPLYGHEITADTNPLEAGLGWVVKLDKPDFCGKAAIEKARAAGPRRQLVGIKALDRGIPRQGYEVWKPDQSTRIGEVTSGTLSPTLNYPIAIAYVATGEHTVGTAVALKVRDKFYPGEIVATPFYKRR
ncbi:MAG: glycine cleavage system aminomethyltransferase GcvT [Bdellovibrionales bacterium]|nr:glycine cleavage system aminomethyltransferase GcvT [Bdellovibrionales bacterium]